MTPRTGWPATSGARAASVVALLAVLLLVGVTSAAMLARPRRVTFALQPSAMPYPTALLKVERPGVAPPTFLVGRGEWGEVTIDLRATDRHEASGVIDLPHLERNDPANLDEAVEAAWLSREGKVLVEVKLQTILAVTPDSASGDPHGGISFTASLEGVRGKPVLTFEGTYLIEENGLAVRTDARRSGDVLTIEAETTVEASVLGWGAVAPAEELVTLTLWFQAAEE